MPSSTETNVVERAFNRLKGWRGIATRYDKHARNYRAGVLIACIAVLGPMIPQTGPRTSGSLVEISDTLGIRRVCRLGQRGVTEVLATGAATVNAIRCRQ